MQPHHPQEPDWRKALALFRETIVRIGRALRPFVDPSTYLPLVALFVISMAVLLLPLAFDVAYALLYAIPSQIRRGFAHGVILTLIAAGVVRLLRVKEADQWPIDPSGSEGAARWIPWALRIAVASLVIPIMEHPDGFGFGDWDFALDKYEALRRTILTWKQFPWWNPWSRGGFPLAAEPQIGAVSMATPLVLALGSTIGLRIAAVLCLLIAVEGAYRLAYLWFREPWGAAASAVVFGLNGGVILGTSMGYILPISFCAIPWMAYAAFRIGRRFSDGLWLGFWPSFMVMSCIQYQTLYSLLLAAPIWLRALRMQPRGRRAALILYTFAAVGMFLLICGWRLGTVLPVILEDRRERVTYWNETPASMLHYLLHRPDPNWTDELNATEGSVFGELSSYVGPLVLALAVLSLASGWRWWHTLTLISYWLAIGSTRWFHPSYWLLDWPFLGSAHVVTRWRYVGLLGLGLAAGSELARWRAFPRRAVRVLAAAFSLITVADFVILGHQQLPRAFSDRPTPEKYPGPPVPDIVNVRDGMGYPAVLRGYGVIRGYEPMLSYYRDAPTLRLPREDPGYRGEAWTDEGTVRPESWSPNRLVFQVKPHQVVHVNQNPGSWWRANGRPAFPGRRCAELMVPFEAEADAQGRLVLEIHPHGLERGLGLHVLGGAILAAAWLLKGSRAGP